MQGILIAAKPLTPNQNPYLLLSLVAGLEALQKYELNFNQPLNIQVFEGEKFCTGWYDIETHINYSCPNKSKVDKKYTSCFACRKKTDFNPAFYHAAEISAQQKAYNQTPHSVYIAYFGGGLTKAGIMADSRGLTRLYEQGAIFYLVIDSYPDAYQAREVEAELIQKTSLAESIRKNQKAAILAKGFQPDLELERFKSILKDLSLELKLELKLELESSLSLDLKNMNIASNFELFANSQKTLPKVNPLEADQPISGVVQAIFGKYLILTNNNRSYGVWLDDLYGYKINLSTKEIPIAPIPEQTLLF